MEFLTWLEHTSIAVWISESDWGYPLLLCAHAVGMAVVVGICVMFAARVLGFATFYPLSAFEKLMPLAWLGFALNAASGTLLFTAKPRRLIATATFDIKIGLIILSGLSVWILMRALRGMPQPAGANAAALTDDAMITPTAKIAAIALVVFWVGAILAGRLIGYTIGPPIPP